MLKIKLPLITATLACLALVGCGNGGLSLGGKPDAFRTVARSGLDIPEPGIGLSKPLPPGSTIKDQGTAQQLAKTVLLGEESATSQSPAPIENQFGQYADSAIAQSVDQEAYLQASKRPQDSFVQRFLAPVQIFRDNSDGVALDYDEETKLLTDKGVSTSFDDYAATGHSIELVQLGDPKYFSPDQLLRQFRQDAR